jgi:tRNA uridine 5-carboxymethylaminomethyl modification enzyme
LKTGTPPRLHRASIDFDRAVSDGRFALEPGDTPPVPFSFLTESIDVEQMACYLVHTNDRVRQLVTANIDKSPLFNGQIQGIGPRYCPSLEDKIVRFPLRDRHQIYLEPEGRDVDEIYMNGFSMSLPTEVQIQIVRALPGESSTGRYQTFSAPEDRDRPPVGRAPRRQVEEEPADEPAPRFRRRGRRRKAMPLWQELPLLLIVAFCLAVLIRTFLSFSIDIELDGVLPWRRGQAAADG